MASVTVLGAAGGLGRAITATLADRGHEVTAVSRRGEAPAPDGGRVVAADLADRERAVQACAGAGVVVMAAQVPYPQWGRELAPLVESALAGARAAGARFVMVDNLYAYGSPGEPISESTPEAPGSRKGAIRRAIGRRLLAAQRDGEARVTIGRLSDYYGPAGTNALVYVLGIARLLRGKDPQALIDPDQPHTFCYLPDAGRGFATLVERPEADGRVWILPAAPAITQRDLMGLLSSAFGRPPRIGRISRPLLALAGLVDRGVRELRELASQWDRPYLTDASAFQAAFGPLETTPHERAAGETVAWFRRQQPTGR